LPLTTITLRVFSQREAVIKIVSDYCLQKRGDRT